MIKIELKTLFFSELDQIPIEVRRISNCIYRIRNKINDYSYIGQARYLLERFRTGYHTHLRNYENPNSNTYLYNALNKYGIDNFEVEILESELLKSELNQREIYWISFYHTFYLDQNYSGGYNMNSGGHNREMLYTGDAGKRSLETRARLYGNPAGAAQTKSALEKSRLTNMRNHGGVLSINTEIGRKHALESQRLNHDGNLAFHTPEAKLKAIESHTKEVRDKIANTQRANHGGVLAFNTPEANLNRAILSHSESANDYRFITSISNRIRLLKSKDLDITLDNYSTTFSTGYKNHILRLKSKWPRLKSYCTWTEEMTTLFSPVLN